MKEQILLGVFVAVEGAHAYSAFLPSIFTIRRFRDTQTQKDIRDGEVIGSLFVLALGGVVAAITRSALPLLLAMVTAGVMVSVYEWALRS